MELCQGLLSYIASSRVSAPTLLKPMARGSRNLIPSDSGVMALSAASMSSLAAPDSISC